MSTTTDRRGGPVGKPSVRNAWHKARGRKVVWVDDFDPESKKKISRHKETRMNPGLSLKAWAEAQIKAGKDAAEGSPAHAMYVLCSDWFLQKSSERDEDARDLRRKNKGPMIDAQKRAVRTGAKGHRKGNGGKKSDGGAKKDEKKIVAPKA